MKLPCEIAVKSVVPAIRALLAKELIAAYSMKQEEVAGLLGITQTAVSKYTHHVRGRILLLEEEEEVRALISQTASSLVEGKLDRTKFALRVCGICGFVRKKGLMCGLCRQASPLVETARCLVCVQDDDLGQAKQGSV